MEVLGHSSFTLTMETYTPVLPALMRDAADAMGRALRNDRTAPDGSADAKVGGQLGGQFGGQTRPTGPKRP
jgi:hypothetical protein